MVRGSRAPVVSLPPWSLGHATWMSSCRPSLNHSAPPPIPPSWVPFSFFSSHSILPTCLSPSLLHVPASVTIYVCLSPEARTRGWRPGTLLGKNTHALHAHAPPATLQQQVGVGGGLAPRCCIHAQGCRLHPCFCAGPQALWHVPAAQRL